MNMVLGLAMNLTRFSSFRVRPEAFSASEKAKPGFVPATVPKTPCKLGPVPGGAAGSIEWHLEHLASNSSLPSSAMPCAEAAVTESRSAAAKTEIFAYMRNIPSVPSYVNDLSDKKTILLLSIRYFRVAHSCRLPRA